MLIAIISSAALAIPVVLGGVYSLLSSIEEEKH